MVFNLKDLSDKLMGKATPPTSTSAGTSANSIPARPTASGGWQFPGFKSNAPNLNQALQEFFNHQQNQKMQNDLQRQMLDNNTLAQTNTAQQMLTNNALRQTNAGLQGANTRTVVFGATGGIAGIFGGGGGFTATTTLQAGFRPYTGTHVVYSRPNPGQLISVTDQNSKWFECVLTVKSVDDMGVECIQRVCGGGVIPHHVKHGDYKVVG